MSQPPDSPLLTVIADANARKIVAAKYALPSGTIPVLLAVFLRKTCHPRHVYRAKIAAQTLVRAMLAQLVKAKLVERSRNGRTRQLRITLAGMGVVGQYERELRAGRRQFSNEP